MRKNVKIKFTPTLTRFLFFCLTDWLNGRLANEKIGKTKPEQNCLSSAFVVS